MEANRFDNIQNPEMSSELQNNISFVYNAFLFIDLFDTEEQIRFISTPPFKEILQQFSGKVNKRTNRKMTIYSAHDTTLGLLMTAFNLTSFECIYNNFLFKNQTENCEMFPGYAASLILELFKKDETNYFVKY